MDCKIEKDTTEKLLKVSTSKELSLLDNSKKEPTIDPAKTIPYYRW